MTFAKFSCWKQDYIMYVTSGTCAFNSPIVYIMLLEGETLSLCTLIDQTLQKGM